MSVKIFQMVTPLKCHRCGHYWNYKGSNRFVATCPHCRTYVTLRKSMVLERQKMVAVESVSIKDE